MKALTTAGLTKLIQLIKSSFISNSDTVTTNTVTLAMVATSGAYSDLSGTPTIPTVNNATLTIQKNGTNVQTFTANASSDATCNITVPTNTSDLTNNSGFITSSALSGYATETWVGNQGYITGIASGDVTTALGYTPYNSSNPSGYITSSAIANMQVTTNLVTSVSSSSTDSQYPSAKLFYDTCGDIETAINTIRGV